MSARKTLKLRRRTAHLTRLLIFISLHHCLCILLFCYKLRIISVISNTCKIHIFYKSNRKCLRKRRITKFKDLASLSDTLTVRHENDVLLNDVEMSHCNLFCFEWVEYIKTGTAAAQCPHGNSSRDDSCSLGS